MRMRLRRSLLITPANRPDLMAKAIGLEADAVVFDLEDGVHPDDKSQARCEAAALLAALPCLTPEVVGRPRIERIVRVNAIGSDQLQADLAMLPLERLDALFLPKVESAAQVRELMERLEAIELAGAKRDSDVQIDVLASIETPRGLLHALDIADAHPRLSALFFGSGDYTAATGSAASARALAFPRSMVVAAAAAAHLQAIDAAYFTDVRNAHATAEDAELAKELGFAGKLVFHPDQIEPVNRVFTPDAAAVARARRIVASYEEAVTRGRATAIVDGDFVAIDTVRSAERIIALADAATRVRPLL